MDLSAPIKDKLQLYSSNIIKWNKAYNLLSASQEDIWNRHILDSTQIFQYIKPETRIIADFGSGAGLPAIPIAIMLDAGNRETEVIMFESVAKKATFLEEVSRVLGLKNISVRNERIENNKNLKVDLITARAFAKIDEIFKVSKSFMKDGTKFILLKGKNTNEEIIEAEKHFTFDYQLVNSDTGDGFIFLAENVKEK